MVSFTIRYSCLARSKNFQRSEPAPLKPLRLARGLFQPHRQLHLETLYAGHARASLDVLVISSHQCIQPHFHPMYQTRRQALSTQSLCRVLYTQKINKNIHKIQQNLVRMEKRMVLLLFSCAS